MMPAEDPLEQRIEQLHRQLDALDIQLENLEREEQGLLSELGITLEQLSVFASNKENFTELSWQKLCSEKERLESKLKKDLCSIKDPRAAKRNLSSLQHVQRHWLYVR